MFLTDIYSFIQHTFNNYQDQDIELGYSGEQNSEVTGAEKSSPRDRILGLES